MTDQHRHEWTRTDDEQWMCAECAETSATCGTCEGPSGSSLLLCRRCQGRADATVRHIARAVDLALPPHRHDDGARFRRPDGGDDEMCEGVESVMWGWVARWSEHVGPSGADWPEALIGWHLWAAHNPEASDWHRYLTSARVAMWRARAEAGLMPQVQAEPCAHCGGDCVRDWADRSWEPYPDGLSDVVRCTRCGMTWGDRTAWRRISRHHLVDLPDRNPAALVTLAQARTIWPHVPPGTWRQWAKRWRDDGEELVERVWTWWAAMCAHRSGERPWWAGPEWDGPGEAPSLAGWMPEQGTDRDGHTLYRVGDLARLVARWERATRQDERAG